MAAMRASLILLTAACLALALPVNAQQMYQWKDSSGKLHFSDKPPDDAKAESPPLIMYATSWCGYCRKARAYLAAKQIPYREVDIEASAANQAEFKKYGGRGVPFFTVGERTMRGFSEAGMNRFLAATR